MTEKKKLVEDICSVVKILPMARLRLLAKLLSMEAKGFKAEVEAKVQKFEQRIQDL